MNRERLIDILTAATGDAIQLEDGSYLDCSTDELEIGDADGTVVRIAFSHLAVAVLNPRSDEIRNR